MKVKQRIFYIVCIVLSLLLFIVTLLCGRGFSSAYALSVEYTSVLDDLQTDKGFDYSKYPSNVNDYSVKVIQVAESSIGELFIYTYQPCQKAVPLTATQINMSLSESVDNTRLYNLTLLNSSGVFCKYKVDDFVLKDSKVRYYNISTIYRNYDKAMDGSSLSNQKSIAFPVGQCWTAMTANGAVYYTMETVDVITITDCFYGSIRVPAGFNMWYSYSCDMHIIAFSTDIRMDKLLEADVSFDYRTVDVGIYNHPDYGEWQSETVTVTYKEKGTSKDHLFGAGSRTWDKIQTSSEFLDTLESFEIETLDETQNGIKKTDWVLAFYDTDYTYDRGGVFGWVGGITDLFGGNNTHFTQVSNATIIRLEFIKDGEVYNLGVVQNKTVDFEIVGGGDDTFADAMGDFVDNALDSVTGVFTNKMGGIPLWGWLLIVVAVVVVLVVVYKLWVKK